MNTDQPRILLVDDVPTNIHVLKEALAPEYAINFATNGETALEIARDIPHPDLILLDIMMPGMDGYEVCRTLKEDEATAHIPVVFVTAKDQDVDEERGFEAGGVDYITKPFSIPLVKARVKNHISLKRHQDFIEHLLKKRTQELEKSEEEYMKLYLRKMDFGFRGP